MRKHVIFCILLFCLMDGSAQKPGLYSSAFDKYSSIDFILYPDARYLLNLVVNEVPDIMTDVLISYGNYQVAGDRIILTDFEHGFQTRCTVKNDGTIQIDRSFRWLAGITFKDPDPWSEEDISEIPYSYINSYDFDRMQIRKEREAYSKNTGDYLSFRFGKYNVDASFKFWIYPDQTYALKFQYHTYPRSSFNFSEGTWSRKGNLLILYDTSLNCNFYILISRDGLTGNQMPSLINGIFEYVRY